VFKVIISQIEDFGFQISGFDKVCASVSGFRFRGNGSGFGVQILGIEVQDSGLGLSTLAFCWRVLSKK